MTVMETETTRTKGPTQSATAVGAASSGDADSPADTGGAGGTETRTDACASAPTTHPRPNGQDHYTISEVVAFVGLTAHTLRWYERIGLMPHIDRSHTGQRRYRNRDLDWLTFVGKLRLTGMPVADMVRYAELVREGDHTFTERHELLEQTRRDVRTRIAELQDTLAVLDYKINFYADARPASERH